MTWLTIWLCVWMVVGTELTVRCTSGPDPAMSRFSQWVAVLIFVPLAPIAAVCGMVMGQIDRWRS